MRIEPIDLGDEPRLRHLVAFEAGAGTPRYETVEMWQAARTRVDQWIGLVALDDAGEPAGVSEASVLPVFGSTSVQMNATVAGADVRVLRAIVEAVARWEHAAAATTIVAHVAEPDERVEQMWQAAGFRRVGTRERLSRTIDPAEPIAAAEPPPGVRIVSLADKPELERQADELWRDVHLDIPTALPFAPDEVLTIRRDIGLADDAPPPGSLFLAVTAGGAVVGISYLDVDPQARAWGGHRMTGVAREWRGRGVARALKQQMLAWAQANGVREVQASNDDRNPAMRRINDELGYVRIRRLVLMRLDLQPPGTLQR